MIVEESLAGRDSSFLVGACPCKDNMKLFYVSEIMSFFNTVEREESIVKYVIFLAGRKLSSITYVFSN